MNKFLKNTPYEEVFEAKKLVEAGAGEISSRTLVQNDHVSVTLFSFDKGEEIATHESEGDALVTVLEGVGRFTVDGKNYDLKAGESLVMPSRKPHAVSAPERFKFMLTVIFQG